MLPRPSLYFQQVLGYKPVEAGIAPLPTTLGVLIAAGAASALTVKVGPKPLMVLGGLPAAGGLYLMSFLTTDSSFWSLCTPAEARRPVRAQPSEWAASARSRAL